MRNLSAAFVFAALTFGSAAVDAQTAANPAANPAASAASAMTATCKDGSSQTGASRRAACKGHGGVQSAKAAAAAPAPEAAAPVAGSVAPPVEQTAPVLGSTPAAKTPHRATAPIVAQTPTNPGDVWVNSATKIYHCPADKAYGRTRTGSFMAEAAAKAAGNRASHNKACTAAAAQ